MNFHGTTRKQVIALAKQLGATVSFNADSDGVDHEIVATAPDGMKWSASDVHELVFSPGDRTPWQVLYDDIYTRMSDGVEPCVGPCEWCERDE